MANLITKNYDLNDYLSTLGDILKVLKTEGYNDSKPELVEILTDMINFIENSIKGGYISPPIREPDRENLRNQISNYQNENNRLHRELRDLRETIEPMRREPATPQIDPSFNPDPDTDPEIF